MKQFIFGILTCLVLFSVFGFLWWGANNLDRIVLGSANYGSDPNPTADITLQNGAYISNATSGTIDFGTANFKKSGSEVNVPDSIASATGALTLPAGRIFYLSGTLKITRLLGGTVGQIVTLISLSTDTLVDGVNLKLAGNFNGTADDAITLIYGAENDTSWYEISRSAN